MAIREFADSQGVRWRVWATNPLRGNVRPQFASGWLTFECPAERRRLAPIPELWADAGDDDLRGFLAGAVVVTRASAAFLQPLQAPLPEETEPLEVTVARVRAVIDAVDETLQRVAV